MNALAIIKIDEQNSIYIFFHLQEFDKERESSSCSPLPVNVNNRVNLASSILNVGKMSPHHQEHNKLNTSTTGTAQTPMNGTSEYISCSI